MTDLDVAVDLGDLTVPAGTAHVDRRRGTLTTDFRYHRDYLATPGAYALDPALPLDAGGGVTRGLPGAFADCAPDRWGRRLITRRIRASEQGPTPRSLSDLDFLLGVADVTRQGALRFRRAGGRDYEHPATEVPRLVRLPELTRAAETMSGEDDPDLSAIKILLAAGTGTLGGARPKASVVDDGGALCIAKLPHPQDGWDVMAWEKTALDLCERTGLRVPARRLLAVEGRSVLLVERFDRVEGRRIGYLSAMSLVGGQDGDQHDYLDVAAELADVSVAAHDDLEQLWRRAAVFVALHNTDDHLRNHGVVRSGSGWALSPLFDVNPEPDPGVHRATSIAWAAGADAEAAALVDAAPQFGLSEQRARSLLDEVVEVTGRWREAAAANGIAESAMTHFETAIEAGRAALQRAASQPTSR